MVTPKPITSPQIYPLSKRSTYSTVYRMLLPGWLTNISSLICPKLNNSCFSPASVNSNTIQLAGQDQNLRLILNLIFPSKIELSVSGGLSRKKKDKYKIMESSSPRNPNYRLVAVLCIFCLPLQSHSSPSSTLVPARGWHIKWILWPIGSPSRRLKEEEGEVKVHSCSSLPANSHSFLKFLVQYDSEMIERMDLG